MWRFLKTTVAEDAITTEEILVVDLAEEVLLQEEKEALHQDVKADLEATEVQLLEKVDLEAKEVLDQEEKVLQTGLQDVTVVLRKDRQDVLKVLVTHQEKEDQEEATHFVNFLIIILKLQNI